MHKPMTKPQTQMFWRLFAKSYLNCMTLTASQQI